MLDQVFIVAFLLGLLNLSKIALRPHQVKLLQDKLETWTLQLDLLIPHYLHLVKRIPELSAVQVFGFSIVILTVGCLMLFNLQGLWALGGYFLMLLSILFTAASSMWKYSSEIFSDISVNEVNIKGGVNLIIALGKAFIILVFSYFAAPILLILLIFDRRHWFYLQAYPNFVMLTLFIFLLLLITQPIMKLLLGLLWRIVEYSSGSWAAILFIATGILGMVKVLNN